MSEIIRELEAKLNTVVDLKTRIDLLNELAWQLRYHDRARLRSLSEEAQTLSTTGPFAAEPYARGLGASLRNLGHLNSNTGDYHLALTQSLRAFNLIKDAHEPDIKTDVLMNLCWTYRGFGDYGVALEYALSALRAAQELGDRSREGEVLNTMSGVYAESKSLDHSISTYHKALYLFQELADKQGESLVLNNLALTHLQAGDCGAALEESLASLEIARANQLTSIELTALGTVGEVYLGMDDLSRAHAYLQQALAMAIEKGSRYDQFWSLLNLGKVYLRQKDERAALDALHQALAISGAARDRAGQFQCHELLAHIYEGQGHYRDALTHFKEFHALKESVFNENTAKRLAGLQVVHQVETAKRDAEIHYIKTIELQKEIEDRKQAQSTLVQLATTDALTGLLNRREFFVLAERAFQRAQRERRRLAAILLDLDHFKRINDTYGHAVGDQVLAGVAQTIRANVREDELVGRYGGDEFVILLPGSTLARARKIARRLHENLTNQRFETERGTLSVGSSLGVAELASADTGLDVLVDHADRAMYSAKRAGRNRTATYQES